MWISTGFTAGLSNTRGHTPNITLGNASKTSPALPGDRPGNCGDKLYGSEGPQHPSEPWDTCHWPAECCHTLKHAGQAASVSNQEIQSRPSQALWGRPLDGPAGRWTWQRECRCQSPRQRPHVLPQCGVWSTTPQCPPGTPSSQSITTLGWAPNAWRTEPSTTCVPGSCLSGLIIQLSTTIRRGKFVSWTPLTSNFWRRDSNSTDWWHFFLLTSATTWWKWKCASVK